MKVPHEVDLRPYFYAHHVCMYSPKVEESSGFVKGRQILFPYTGKRFHLQALSFSSKKEKIERLIGIITAESTSLSIYDIIWQHGNSGRGINNGMLIPSGIIVSALIKLLYFC